jgi:queuine/archaeosine tRNA-ribosyltransferase
MDEKTTNIERTVENVVKCLDLYPEVSWLIPIQGWNKQPKSVLRCLQAYKDYGIKANYYGVANLCVERNAKIIIQTVRYVKGFLGNNVKLHVFGLRLPVALKLRGEIYSFDSMAWTRPVDKPGHSCKNNKEREEYFKKWIKKLGLRLKG